MSVWGLLWFYVLQAFKITMLHQAPVVHVARGFHSWKPFVIFNP